MSVKSIMSSPTVNVEMDDTLAQVHEIFSSTHFHHVVVVENNKVFGIVSDRDLLRALSPNLGTPAEKPSDAATLNKKVHQIMTRKPICLEQDDSIFEAINIFEQHHLSCIPVVNGRREPVGIIGWRDIFKAIRRRPDES